MKAIEHPRHINIDLVNAQQARRVLDRIVGFELSPVLWRKIKPALSAGRVQSVAVRLIVEREREINAFTCEASYKVVATFKDAEGAVIRATLGRRFKTKEEAQRFLENARMLPSKSKILLHDRLKNHRHLLLLLLHFSRKQPVSLVLPWHRR